LCPVHGGCALIFGHLTASDYEDSFAADPRIDALREKMDCSEEPAYTADYHDPEKRSIANSLTLSLTDGSTLTETVEYPSATAAVEARASHCSRRSSAPTWAAGLHRSGSSDIGASLNQQPLERMPVHSMWICTRCRDNRT